MLPCAARETDMNRRFFVYILTNGPRGVLYVGVTNDLIRRLTEHKAKLVPGFTKAYGVVCSSITKNIHLFWKLEHAKRPSSAGGERGR
jgi:predicted GIY-YIG superfamily endonuclease